MIKPSEKSLCIAEELVDYVHPGMSRAAAIQEVAQMLDEMNSELVEAVSALVNDASAPDPQSQAVLLEHLKETLAQYQPWRVKNERQHELFVSNTSTATQSSAVAGQMP